MKILSSVVLSVWLMGMPGLILAQTTVATVAVSRPPTKAAIKARIRALEARVKADSRFGKLTQVQADAFLANLKAIRDKMKADLAENGKKGLTGDQEVELNDELDAVEKALSSPNGFNNSN